jgi:flavin-dependent dehydrogenase
MRSLKQYEDTLIAILGGGPAGLSAALHAAELGFKVDLYEQKKIGSGNKCVEGFIDTLIILGKPEAGVLYPVKKAVLSAGKAHTVQFGRNCGFWMIDRTTWQRAMAKRSRLAKVRVEEDFSIGKSQSQFAGNRNQTTQ